MVSADQFPVRKPLRKTKCKFRRYLLPFCTMEALPSPSTPPLGMSYVHDAAMDWVRRALAEELRDTHTRQVGRTMEKGAFAAPPIRVALTVRSCDVVRRRCALSG